MSDLPFRSICRMDANGHLSFSFQELKSQVNAVFVPEPRPAITLSFRLRHFCKFAPISKPLFQGPDVVKKRRRYDALEAVAVVVAEIPTRTEHWRGRVDV
jgi:hypothetical protein